jgi:uncharacterized membrane protein
VPHVSFPQGALANEQMLLCWIHIVSGVIWSGLLYFLNLAGTPMSAEAERLARWAFLASRVRFWLLFPMLFLMGAADHYPFLSGIAK